MVGSTASTRLDCRQESEYKTSMAMLEVAEAEVAEAEVAAVEVVAVEVGPALHTVSQPGLRSCIY